MKMLEKLKESRNVLPALLYLLPTGQAHACLVFACFCTCCGSTEIDQSLSIMQTHVGL